MSRVEAVSAWEQTVSSHLPHLSKPQATVLALWSYGVVAAQCCGQTSVAAALAVVLGQRQSTLRQRRREWLYAAEDKRGRPRRAVVVESCLAPLLGWVLAWWTPASRQERRLVLAVDATSLGDRFVVLALGVLYRGCAIPVAWSVVPATQSGAWRPHWERLLAAMQASVPAGWTVLVLADRGLYAPWLFRAIVLLGWHPGLRLNSGEVGSGLYRVVGRRTWRPLAALLPGPGTAWRGRVDCFRDQTIRGTLLARWEPGYKEGWVLLTDLPANRAEVAWYGLRAWIECGFKDLKRDGWQWQRTRTTDPERAGRCWLVLAVATLWVVGVGGHAEDTQPASARAALPPTHVARRRATGRAAPRLLSCFHRGLLVLSLTLPADPAGPTARFCPTPWPTATRPKTYP
ncbi:MAG: transposase [Ktedonobacterales bacterium]